MRPQTLAVSTDTGEGANRTKLAGFQVKVQSQGEFPSCQCCYAEHRVADQHYEISLSEWVQERGRVSTHCGTDYFFEKRKVVPAPPSVKGETES